MSTTPVELDVAALPVYTERTFVPADADLARAEQVEALLTRLLQREVASAAELEAWLMDRSELEAALAQTGSVLRIRMTCQTDDEARAAAYQDFVKTVAPVAHSLGDKLNRKYAALSERFPLDAERYMVHDRALKTDLELFREENVPLHVEESLLSQEYQTVTGAMTVEFQGQERTLPQMAKFLLEPDRAVREAAFRAVAERRLQDADKLEDVLDKMLDVRQRIAGNAGFANFQDYQFRNYHRFDYTPEDCRAFGDAVQRCIVPVCRDMLRRRRDAMQLDALRPWDTAVDELGRPPLKPFETPAQLVAGARDAFARTDPELGAQFAQMDELGLLDLASRKGKAPGGYQSTLSELRKPFIFMNAVGTDRDVRTLLHEGGHAFHALASAHDPLLDYRHAPMEFCEVASMSMELLAGEHIDVFYADDAERERSVREHLEGTISLLPWVATIDSFQDWLYAHPGHTVAERRAAWLDVRQRFATDVVDWSGLDQEHACMWHRQLHIFEVPFYYIEYGIAQLGALQVWLRSRQEGTARALADYRKALTLGGSRPLPELFAAAGINFDFTESTIAPLAEAVGEALA